MEVVNNDEENLLDDFKETIEPKTQTQVDHEQASIMLSTIAVMMKKNPALAVFIFVCLAYVFASSVYSAFTNDYFMYWLYSILSYLVIIWGSNFIKGFKK